MKSEGVYDRYSYIQKEVIALGIPLLKDACKQIDLNGVKKDFVIADFGCATGGNSIAPIKAAIQEIRHRASNRVSITVIHTDQVRNDYSSLFKLLYESESSYIRNFENVHMFYNLQNLNAWFSLYIIEIWMRSETHWNQA